MFYLFCRGFMFYLFCRGFMFYLCYLYLFTYTGMQQKNILFISDDVRVL